MKKVGIGRSGLHHGIALFWCCLWLQVHQKFIHGFEVFLEFRITVFYFYFAQQLNNALIVPVHLLKASIRNG